MILYSVFLLGGVVIVAQDMFPGIAKNATNLGIDPWLIGKTVFEIIPDNRSYGVISRDNFPRQPAASPSVVYRAELLSPDDLEKQGAFLPRGMGSTRPSQNSPDYSLYNHIMGTVTGSSKHDSVYVSTTTSKDFARQFLQNQFGGRGYIYEIHVSPNMIDVSGTLGHFYTRTQEREFSSLGPIWESQVLSYTEFREGVEQPEVRNPKYDKRFDFAKSGGVQPQLAGFPDKHAAWKQEPWNKFSSCARLKRDSSSLCSPLKTPIEYTKEYTAHIKQLPGYIDKELPKPIPPKAENSENAPKSPAPKYEKKPKPVGKQIQENRFLQFLTDMDPQPIGSLIKALKYGEITLADVQLGFKRALSEVTSSRWTDFGNAKNAAESLKNIVIDITSTVRYKTPVGFWGDVINRLLDIAKEISMGKTPEEKLKIANKNLNDVVKLWSFTPIGLLNEALMKESAAATPPVQATAVVINRLWSYTPLGWLINQVAPVEPLLRTINAREEILSLVR